MFHVVDISSKGWLSGLPIPVTHSATIQRGASFLNERRSSDSGRNGDTSSVEDG